MHSDDVPAAVEKLVADVAAKRRQLAHLKLDRAEAALASARETTAAAKVPFEAALKRERECDEAVSVARAAMGIV